MSYNLEKLTKELKDAEIPIHGVSGDGGIDFKDEATQEQRDAAEVIKTNHNPVWYVDQRRAAYPTVIDQLDLVYWDMKNATNIWVETIDAIKLAYPKE